MYLYSHARSLPFFLPKRHSNIISWSPTATKLVPILPLQTLNVNGCKHTQNKNELVLPEGRIANPAGVRFRNVPSCRPAFSSITRTCSATSWVIAQAENEDQEAKWHQIKTGQLLDLIMEGTSASFASAPEEGPGAAAPALVSSSGLTLRACQVWPLLVD